MLVALGLMSQKNGAFEEMHALSLVEQLVEGLFYLHQKGLLHRSIEPGNLLLTNNIQTLKIAGFSKLTMLSEIAEGSSVSEDVPAAARRRLQELTTINSAWASPEHVQGLTEDSRSDIWSCGLCACFFIAGRHAFSSPYGTPALGEMRSKKSLSKRFSVALLQGMSCGARAFIKACLEPNPAKRPWSMELRLHPVLMMRSCKVEGYDAISDAAERFQSKTLGSLDKMEDIPPKSPTVHRPAFRTSHALPTITSDGGVLSGCGLLSSGSSDMHPQRRERVVQDRSLSKKVANVQVENLRRQQAKCYTLDSLPVYSSMDAPQIEETRAEVAKAVPSYSTLDALPAVEVFLHPESAEKQGSSCHSTWNRRVVRVQEEGETRDTAAQSLETKETKTKEKNRGGYSSCPL